MPDACANAPSWLDRFDVEHPLVLPLLAALVPVVLVLLVVSLWP